LAPFRNSRADDLRIFAIAIVAAGLLCGCVAQQPIRFGMYYVPQSKLRDARELGIDFIIGPGQRDYLDEAAQADLQVITPAKAKIRHRALMGTILSDEPDLRGIAPEEIAVEYNHAKRHAHRPVFLNLSSGFSAEAYARHCDVLMFDWYPVNWTPTETFYSQLRTARLAARKKPFFAVIQTFDWTKYPGMMPEGSYRKPTAAEVKAMTLWAAMNGARGIAFYPYDDGHDALEHSPELKTAIKESIALVRHYDWLFKSPRVWIEYPFQFQLNTDKTNAIAETSIAIRAARLAEHPDTTFIIAANTTDRAITVKPLLHFDQLSGEIRFEALEVKFLTTNGARMR
jgi:hypothetical protein